MGAEFAAILLKHVLPVQAYMSKLKFETAKGALFKIIYYVLGQFSLCVYDDKCNVERLLPLFSLINQSRTGLAQACMSLYKSGNYWVARSVDCQSSLIKVSTYPVRLVYSYLGKRNRIEDGLVLNDILGLLLILFCL